jgi:hypothetical protein
MLSDLQKIQAGCSHLLCGGWLYWCATSRHVPYSVRFGMFFMHRACGNGARVTGAVRHALGSKNERYRAFKDKYTRVKLVCMRLTMPVWFDFAFANLIALLPQAGFKFGPIHRLLPLELADAWTPYHLMYPYVTTHTALAM